MLKLLKNKKRVAASFISLCLLSLTMSSPVQSKPKDNGVITGNIVNPKKKTSGKNKNTMVPGNTAPVVKKKKSKGNTQTTGVDSWSRPVKNKKSNNR